MKILYFASLKENLNTAHDEINVVSPVSISSIKKQLIDKYGAQYRSEEHTSELQSQ